MQHWILSTGHWTLDTVHWTQDTGPKNRINSDTENRLLGTNYLN